MRLILAIDSKRGLSRNGKIPWKNPAEMQFFREMTLGKTVVMGRKTHQSIGHDLKDRVNLVVQNGNYQDILKEITAREAAGEEVWCIGGKQLAASYLDRGLITEYFISKIEGDYQCDLRVDFLEDFTQNFWHRSIFREGNGFTVYRGMAPNYDENHFKALIMRICQEGDSRQDRTGMGTRSLFGEQLKFILYRGNQTVLPVSTLRSSFTRGIFEELMWFIRGQTDSKILEEKKVNIWKKNSQKEVTAGMGLNYPDGDCGPIYGFQWRHWGRLYPSTTKEFSSEPSPESLPEYDQLAVLIEGIKKTPLSRRLILSAWNVADLDKMVLPPCHVLYQFEVSANGRLSCHMYQRSSDIILAGMWNITSAALLTILLSKVTGLQPGVLTVSYGNVHVYNNHPQAKIDQLMARQPYPFPTLTVKNRDNIADFTWEDLQIAEYQSNGPIDFEMNV